VEKKLIIIIGGNRVGNYETFAPIVNELKITCNYETLTIFQSKSLYKKILQNKILTKVYLSHFNSFFNYGVFSFFHNSKLIISCFIKILKYQKVSMITNRNFGSFLSRIFIFFLKKLKVETYYTKSFCRAPTNNLRSLLGGKSTIRPSNELCSYALIPSLEHRIEYGLLGYKLNQFVVTGYPKFYPSWTKYLNDCANSIEVVKSDLLFVFTKNYDNLDNIIKKIVETAFDVKGLNSIVLKPHPTTTLSIIERIITDISVPPNKTINISEENSAFLANNSKLVLSYATSASYDAKVFGKYLINYYDIPKKSVDKYRGSAMSDIPDFWLMESSVLSDFLSDEICYGVTQLKHSLKTFFSSLNSKSEIKSEIKSDSKSLINHFV
jgi:hypothetical protein